MAAGAAAGAVQTLCAHPSRSFPPHSTGSALLQIVEERRRIDAEADEAGKPRGRTSLRLAAMRLAINKVANVEMKRGTILGG